MASTRPVPIAEAANHCSRRRLSKIVIPYNTPNTSPAPCAKLANGNALPTPQIDFQRTPVTLMVTAIAAAIEIASLLKPELRNELYVYYRLGMLSPVWSGELWRPLTGCFLHGGLIHAVFNIYWMLIFASAVEVRFGSYRTFALIVLLAFVTSLPEFVVMNYSVVDVSAQRGIVGLSGILYGLFGLLWMGRRYEPSFYYVCTDSTVRFLLFWFVFCIEHSLLWCCWRLSPRCPSSS